MSRTLVKTESVAIEVQSYPVRYFEERTVRGLRRYSAEILLGPGDRVILDGDSVTNLEARATRLVPATLYSRMLARTAYRERRRRVRPLVLKRVGRRSASLLRQDRVFELLRDSGLDDGLGWNLDRFTGGRIAAHPRLALLHHQLHHPGQHELARALQLLFRQRRQLVEILAGLRPLDFEPFGEMRKELGFAHSSGVRHRYPPGHLTRV